MVDPKEGNIACDPASGSGGFLIRFFDIVRQQILMDADNEYQEYKRRITAKYRHSARGAEELRKKYEAIQASIDQRREGSRTWRLSNTCIYGTDANDRMAWTSKMNMILHGDGHGGVHQHNGFINVNGIFEERFDIILTNPPFGAYVEPSDVLTEEQIATSPEQFRRYSNEYGDLYKRAQAHVAAARGKPIASLFELPTQGGRKLGKIKTEILFIERCLSLLKPGGRLGIVLPEGIFNNPSLAYVREFCEDRAYIRAVVSLPQDTFVSTGATVKASLLFMQKFTAKEKIDYDRKKAAADKEIREKYTREISAAVSKLKLYIEKAAKNKDADRRKQLQAELRQYEKDMEAKLQAEAGALLKEQFAYPVFLYEAQHVGITATGEPDTTELYEDAKLGLPAGVTADATALALYRAFRSNPDSSVRVQA
jgi:type I restriction enzyme M protein